MDHILVSIEYIKMMDNQMRSIIQVTVHLGFQTFYTIQYCVYIYIYIQNKWKEWCTRKPCTQEVKIAQRFSNSRKESTPCDGDDKRK